MKKYISITLSTLTLLTCFTGCGDKKSSGKSNTDSVEAQTAALSTVAATDKEHRDDDQDTIQKALEEQKKAENKTPDEPESGIIKHTDRPNEGYYLEDYITVNFTGYEHDSAVEMNVNWDAAAADLGNCVTSEMLETIFHVDIRNTEDKFDRFKMDDLVNGDMVVLHIDESTKYETYEMKYPEEMEYIDENLQYYEETPVIVSGLKTKEFITDTGDVDKAAIITLCDKKIDEIKNSAKDSTYMLENNYGSNIIDYVIEGKEDESFFLGKANYYTITNYKIESTYLAARTLSSYNDSSASQLPENMVFCTYKLTIERKDNGEVFDMYYRIEIGNVLFENDKMVISDDDVKVQLARIADDAMPDSKYWEIEEVK